MADDPRVGFVADLVDIGHVDPEALHEALIAQDIDRRLGWREVEEGDPCVLGGIAERRGGPLADQFARKKVVRRKCHVGGFDRLKRRVERDDQHSCILCLPDRGNDALGIGRRDENSLRAIGDAGLYGRYLAFAVAVDLAGVGFQVDAKLLGLGGGAFLHLHEEGIGVRLGNEAGGNCLCFGGGGQGHPHGKRCSGCCDKRFSHVSLLPERPLGARANLQAIRVACFFPPAREILRTGACILSINKSD